MTEKGHQQTWVKVNTHVDTAIADLIRALALFPKLQTISSCQGGAGEGRNSWPSVSFKYGEQRVNDWRDLSEFVLGYFGPGLTKSLGDRIDIYIRVTEAGNIRARLFVHPDSLARAVRVVKLLARRFTA